MTPQTTRRFLKDAAIDEEIPLPSVHGLPPSKHVLTPRERRAINASLACRRPLLVRGEPGMGKSQLARAAASALGRALLHHVVDARTEPRDLLWTVDAVSRLAEAQLVGAMHSGNRAEEVESRRRVELLGFVQPGILWWAMSWPTAAEQASRAGVSPPSTPEGWTPANGVVVLVDEIDKADASVPNALLDVLGHGRFDVPTREPVASTDVSAPLILFTTNEERTLPDAFLRRCMVLHLTLPENEDELVAFLAKRGRAQLPEMRPSAKGQDVFDAVGRVVAKARQEMEREDLLRPGVAEYIDLLRVLHEQRPGDAEGQLELLELVKDFALNKHLRERES